jgi:molecular chaperone HtpG
MDDSLLLQRLKEFASADPSSRQLLVLVERVFDECCGLMKTVVRNMPEYTLHDEVHLHRIVELMGRILPEATCKQLKPLEIGALLLSAALHDVGMAPSHDEIRDLISGAETPKRETQWAYVAFREIFPTHLRRQEVLRKSGDKWAAQEVEAFLLSEFLRKSHAERGRRIIFERYGGDLVYGNFNFAARLAEVCFSHNEDVSFVQTLPCWELVRAPGEYCNWRFIAIVLRLCDILDFDAKRTPSILFEHLGLRSSISIREWKKHRSITAWDIRPGFIAFSAQCSDPVIEKCIRDFVAIIDKELLAASALASELHHSAKPDLAFEYNLDLPVQVDTRCIAALTSLEGPLYEFVDLSFYLDRDNIVSLIMGIALYAEPILFLRELLQNSVDACRHRRALHHAHPDLGSYTPELSVRIRKDGLKECIEVEDNGMGMDSEIVRKYLARVGRSYYRSGEFLENRAKNGLQFSPVSHFGIGILSVFMAGDKLKVETCRVGRDSKPLQIAIEGEGSLFWFSRSTREIPGTRMTVMLKQPIDQILRREVFWEPSRREVPSLIKTVSDLAPHVEFPILVDDGKSTQTFAGDWQLPDASTSHPPLEQIRLNLTGATGITGVIEVLILEGFSTLWAAGRIQEDDEEDTYTHRDGYIECATEQRLARGGSSTGYSIAVDNRGTWTQQGFAVVHPLFAKHSHWHEVSEGPNIPFPLPVSYNIDLTGPLTMSLSADRKRILPTVENKKICAEICSMISGLLFAELGNDRVRQNEAFFRQIGESCGESEVFLGALASFLGKTDAKHAMS